MTKFATMNGEPSPQALRPDFPGLQGMMSGEDFRTLAIDNPDQAFIISLISRPGFAEFLQELEWELYTPDSPENIKFEMFTALWDRLPAVVAAFPLKDLNRAIDIASNFGISLKQGIPFMFTTDSETPLTPKTFPMDEGPNVYTASGFSEELNKLPVDEQHRRFETRMRELQRSHGITP
jgi:hypothetical protein